MGNLKKADAEVKKRYVGQRLRKNKWA